MKQINQLLYTGLAFVMIFSSCSITKRHYNRGYHVDWFGRKHNAKKEVLAIKKSEKKTQKKDSIATYHFEDDLITSQESVDIRERSPIISMNNPINPKEVSLVLLKKSSGMLLEPNSLFHKEDVILKNPKLNHRLITSHPTELSSKTDNGNAALRGIGWFFLILGIIFVLIISIIIGILLMLLGLIFVIAGRDKEVVKPASNTKPEQHYEDVVYLKNGGLIRGMIIEQIPNVQLKIQTKDGNIFVYKMDEIEKIAKELVK